MAIVLVLHERPEVRASVGNLLRSDGHVVHEARDCAAAERVLNLVRVDMVWNQGEMAQCSALDAIPRIEAQEDRLLTAVRAVVPGGRVPERPLPSWQRVVAVDPVTVRTYQRALQIASADTSVLITGESGTGKEVLAETIHAHSRRSGHAFVPVNCGAVPDALVESELFGYKKGAFTGAISDKRGLVEEAHQGILFLDELGEMSSNMQVRLLRFLDTGEVRRVGETRVGRVDVRVVAATNRDLEADVKSGRFRHDLYYRIAAISLRAPPLRERVLDIPELVDRLIQDMSSRHGKPAKRMSDEVWAVLRGYSWPGNIRELQGVIRSAFVFSTGDCITLEDLPAWMYGAGGPCLDTRTSWSQERDRLLAVLKQCRGNRRAAAATLGISRTTLWRRLRAAPSGKPE
jgi:DNA-binding NtrC family response regulator